MYHRSLFNEFVNKRFLSQQSINQIKKDKTSTFDTRINPKTILWDAIVKREIKSAEDWKCIRKDVLEYQGYRNPFNTYNIDAMTIGILTSMKKYDLAENYINFLQQENTKINLATIGKYFNLFYEKKLENVFNTKDEQQILLLYDNIRKSYPVLDSVTLENVIPALSLTEKWRTCLELIEEVKISKFPSLTTHSVIISAAFRNNEKDLAWKLLAELLESGKTPEDIVFLSYLENEKLDLLNLEKLFYLLQLHNVKISENVAKVIQNLGNNLGFKARLSQLNGGGLCFNCKQNMQNFVLTDKDFNELKADILNNVIIGEDIFNKTSEKELNKFKNFVEKMEKFDVVVDGLNVAYSKGRTHSAEVLSGLVCEVVKYFVQKGNKVLVLGRTHMNKWKNRNWIYVLQNSTVFLTEDLSHDDPYLLYCALNCGKNTIIVSRDLMRSHKFLLKTYQHKFLFDRWLSQSQYQLITVTKAKKVIFREPLPYSDVIQKNGNYWHLPCIGEKNNAESVVTNMWLCLKLDK